MRSAFAFSLAMAVLLFALLGPARASERRPRVEQDDCSRRTTQCEQRCDSKNGAERLSCKTDCRLAESRCRNSRR